MTVNFRLSTIDSPSCGGRNRTCAETVNSRPPVPARAPPQCQVTGVRNQWAAIKQRVMADSCHLFPVGVVGFEPTISCSRSTRINQAFPHAVERSRVEGPESRDLSWTLDSQPSTPSERPAGIEPALPPWQGGRLPLHHGRIAGWLDCQRTLLVQGPESSDVTDCSHSQLSTLNPQSTGRDSNPRPRVTKAGSCRWTTSALM